MSGELILITGVSGFIKSIKEALPQHLIPGVEYVVVENLTAENAFDGLVKDVGYERDYFRPAIDITINVLSAAEKSSTVKRIVMTSSINPLLNIYGFAGGVLKKDVYRSDDETYHYDVKTPFPHDLLAYAASKRMALDAAENFMTTKKPAFDIVCLMPSLVIGHNLLARTPEEFVSGTNKPLMSFLLGERRPMPTLGSSASIDDVAKLHVFALKETIPAGKYLVSSGGSNETTWMNALAIVKKHFPNAVGKTFAENGELKTVPINVDVSKTEKAFGFNFQSFEEQVKSAVGYYLSLASK